MISVSKNSTLRDSVWHTYAETDRCVLLLDNGVLELYALPRGKMHLGLPFVLETVLWFGCPFNMTFRQLLGHRLVLRACEGIRENINTSINVSRTRY